MSVSVYARAPVTFIVSASLAARLITVVSSLDAGTQASSAVSLNADS